MNLDSGPVLFAVLTVLLIVGWAIVRGPKVFHGWFDSRKRLSDLKALREEYGSETLERKRSQGEEEWPPRRQGKYLTGADIAESTAAKESVKTFPSDFMPWVSMLVKPAATIRQIVDVDPQLHVMLLSCLYGMNALLAMNDGFRADPLSRVHSGTLLAIVLLAGPVVGMISISLMSWCNRMVAEFLGGEATEHETQAAVAWSVLPHLYALPLALATAVVNAPDVGVDRTGLATNLIYLNRVASSVAGLWSFIICLIALAEVNRFSRWRAFFTLILAFLMVGLLFGAVVLFFVAIYFVLS